MASVLRTIGGILVGLAAAFGLVIAVELFSSVVHPLPADFNGTHEEMCAHVANYPHWALAAVVPMWGFTAFVGTWIAGRLGSRGGAVFVGLLLLGAVFLNLAMLPYPVWFTLVQPVAVLAAVGLGCRLSSA